MTSLAKKLGCVSASLIFLAFIIPLMFVWAWSGAHCEPVPSCQRHSERLFAMEAAVLAASAGILGLCVAGCVSALAKRRDDQGESAGFVLTAILLSLVATGAVITVGYELL